MASEEAQKIRMITLQSQETPLSLIQINKSNVHEVLIKPDM